MLQLVIKRQFVFQEKGMWVEALKSCREYLPAKLDALQAEYDRECGARVTRDINSLFVQASQWEQNGEFKTAVDCLLKVNWTTKIIYYNIICVVRIYSKLRRALTDVFRTVVFRHIFTVNPNQ